MSQQPPAGGWGGPPSGPWPPPDPGAGAQAPGHPPGQASWAPGPGWATPPGAGPGGRLVAGPGYTPPRLIRWPVVTGVVLLVAYVALVAAVVAGSGGTGGGYYSPGALPGAQQAWVLAHQAQLAAIDSDQTRLRADSPSNGGDPSVWLGDWARFHDDVLAASALPDPGGAASPYWHQMLGYYIKGSSELVGALRAGDAAGQAQAVRDLTAGDQAARQFDQAMGLSNPSG